MSMYKVIAIHTFNGRVERREVEECDGVTKAFDRFGYHAARSNGVIVLDDTGGVWAEYRPQQINYPTEEQRLTYQLYLDEPTYRRRIRDEAGDEAVEMADAFLDANPDVAF